MINYLFEKIGKDEIKELESKMTIDEMGDPLELKIKVITNEGTYGITHGTFREIDKHMYNQDFKIILEIADINRDNSKYTIISNERYKKKDKIAYRIDLNIHYKNENFEKEVVNIETIRDVSNEDRDNLNNILNCLSEKSYKVDKSLYKKYKIDTPEDIINDINKIIYDETLNKEIKKMKNYYSGYIENIDIILSITNKGVELKYIFEGYMLDNKNIYMKNYERFNLPISYISIDKYDFYVSEDKVDSFNNIYSNTTLYKHFEQSINKDNINIILNKGLALKCEEKNNRTYLLNKDDKIISSIFSTNLIDKNKFLDDVNSLIEKVNKKHN